jgi:hypothetical protein
VNAACDCERRPNQKRIGVGKDFHYAKASGFLVNHRSPPENKYHAANKTTHSSRFPTAIAAPVTADRLLTATPAIYTIGYSSEVQQNALATATVSGFAFGLGGDARAMTAAKKTPG